jgi:hypothetical protein
LWALAISVLPAPFAITLIVDVVLERAAQVNIIILSCGLHDL